MLTVGAVIGGGSGLVRRRPLAVLAWALIYAVMIVVTMFATRPFFAMRVQGPAPPGDPGAATVNAGYLLFRLLPIELLGFVAVTVLMTAAQRAILQPEQSRLAYLRLGMDELRMLTVGLLLLIGSYIAFVITTIVLVALLMAIAAAVGVAATGLIFGVAMLIAFGLFVFLEIRLSLAFPLTLLRRKIVIGESWRLTRGRFWTLLGGLLSIFLLLLLLWIAVAAVLQGTYWSEVMHAAGNPEAMQEAAAREADAQLALTPATIAGWLVAGLVGALAVALLGGGVATAVRLLVDDGERIAETFA